jgi:hypothetical protein
MDHPSIVLNHNEAVKKLGRGRFLMDFSKFFKLNPIDSSLLALCRWGSVLKKTKKTQKAACVSIFSQPQRGSIFYE